MANTTYFKKGSHRWFATSFLFGLLSSALPMACISAALIEKPTIVVHPDDAISHVGGNVNFEVVTTGTGPFNYQWKFNGADLITPNSAILSLSGVTKEYSGVYSVAVSNEAGTTLSRNANLCITPTAGGPVSFGFSPRRPFPNGITVFSSVYRNKRYYCVGENGVVSSSADAVQWEMHDSTVGVDLNGIAEGNGILVTVGNEGCVLTSTDGVHWWQRTSGSTESLKAVAFGAGKFVAVGKAGTILTSSDGITWSPDSGASLESWNGVAFGNSRFVVVGSGGVIKTSEDGVTWIAQSSGVSTDLAGVYFRGSKFFAMGSSAKVLISGDGLTWSVKTIDNHPTDPCDLTCGGGGENIDLLFGENGATWLSYNSGTSWIRAPSFSGKMVYSLVHGESGYVALGESSVYSSPDALVWTLRGQDLESIGQSLVGELFAEKDGVYHLISSGWNLSTSTNGFDWHKEPIRKPISQFSPSGLASGNGKLVAFGSGMFVGEGIFTSENGLDWKNTRPRNDDDFEGTYYEFFGGGRFILAGYNWKSNASTELIVSSADGETWQKSSLQAGSGSINSLGYGKNVFVAVSNGGRIYSSADSLNWTRRLSGSTSSLEGVTYFKDKFFAVSKARELLSSSDGVTWDLTEAPWSAAKSSLDSSNGTIAGTKDCIFVVSSSGGKYLSQDGKEWRKIHSSNDKSNSRAVKAIGNRVFATIGYNLCQGVARPLVESPEIRISGPSGRMHGFQTIDFSGMRLGESTKVNLLIENAGGSDLRGLGFNLTGRNAGDFRVTGLDVPILRPNAKLSIVIEFIRGGKGGRWADLQIISSDPARGSFMIPLICSALEEPDISINQPVSKKLVDNVSTCSFGVIRKGKSLGKVFIIKNTGNTELNKITVATKGGQAVDFSVNSPPLKVLKPGDSTTFKVTFKPTGKGVRGSTLYVKSNDPDESPFEIRLIGEGG